MTAPKVLQYGFNWPSLFQNTHEHAQKCDIGQQTEGMSKRNEMSLQNMPKVKVFFYCWDIYFVGSFPTSFSNEYILERARSIFSFCMRSRDKPSLHAFRAFMRSRICASKSNLASLCI